MNQLTTQEKLKQLAQQEEIDLRQYWATIRRHKWGILGLAFVITLLTALVVFSMQPVYRATATLLIESQEAKVVSIEEIYGLGTRNEEYYATQFEIMKSRELADKAIDRLNLGKHPEFDPEQQPSRFNLKSWLPIGLQDNESGELKNIGDLEKKRKQALINQFLGRLTITPIRKTQLVQLSFEAHDAELAANAVNTLADVYIESHLEARLEMTQKATEWLTGRMENLKTKLTTAEHRLQDFREKENLVDLQGVRTLSTNEVQNLAGKLLELKEHRSLMENLVNQVDKLKDEPLDVLESIPAVLKHPLMQNLKNQESQSKNKIAELSKRYGPEHPKILAAQSELKSIQDNMRSQIKVVIAGIEKEYDAARENEAAITQALDNTKKDVQQINRKEFQLKELEREVDSGRKLYETFFTRFQETSATGDLQTVNARLMDPAVVPQAPSKPKKGMSLAIAFAVSLILGILMAFLFEHLDNTFKDSEDVENKLGVSILGLIPMAKLGKRGKLNPLEIFSEDQNAAIAESIRSIRTGLVLSGLDNPHKVALITSSVPGEGKSTTSVALAIALGQMERVLLIDADMRRPSVHRMFGMPADSPGLSDLVAGTSSAKDCIHKNEQANIDIIPAGTIPPNPLELLSSARFGSVLAELEKQYDRIIIDSPPAQAVSDPLVLSTYAKAVLYIVKADSTPYHMAKTGIKRLLSHNAPLTGVVLNQLDVDKAAKYGNYSYYKEGYYGGYTSQKSET